MNKHIAVALILLLPALSQAQLGGLMKKVKNKAEQRLEQKVDRGIDRSLDQLEGKPTAAPAQNTPAAQPAAAPAATQTEAAKPEKETIKSYSKFDFVPGERIIYAEDFAQDAIGELPLTWNASGKGEV
jgi:hypothetical protein